MAMKEVSVVIICLLLISVVRGEDLTCKPGEGIVPMFTSGLASQCSGLSKITTEAECKLAAEYNRKNNIDKNGGYGGRRSVWDAPPGCFYYPGYKYIWNDYAKLTNNCSDQRKCICKPKTCTKCPINTYSEGGTNPTCTPCPTDRPFTAKFSDQQSIASCAKSKDDLTCKTGYGQAIFTSGDASQCSGLSKITTEAECKLAAEYNSKNNIDKNEGYRGRWTGSNAPPGCFYSVDNKYYYWNYNTKSTGHCSNSQKCICKTKTCIKCPINTYSKGGINPICTPRPKKDHVYHTDWSGFRNFLISTVVLCICLCGICCCCRYRSRKKKAKLKEKKTKGSEGAMTVDAVELVEAPTYSLDDLQNFDYENYNIVDTDSHDDDAMWSIDTTWNYISSEGIMLGPFKTAELVVFYEENNLNSLTCIDKTTLIRSENGMESWRRLYEMPALCKFVGRSLVTGIGQIDNQTGQLRISI